MQTTINTQTSPLTEAAQVITDTFKTPEKFIDFMTDVLGWVHEFEVEVQVDKVSSIHSNLTHIMRKIGFKWMKAGDDEVVNMISEAIFDLTDDFGSDHLHDMNGIIAKAHSNYIRDFQINKESYINNADGMFALIKLREAFESHEYNKK